MTKPQCRNASTLNIGRKVPNVMPIDITYNPVMEGKWHRLMETEAQLFRALLCDFVIPAGN